MYVLIPIITCMGSIIAFGGAFYIFIMRLKYRKMKIINQDLNNYIKNKNFLLMKNGGEDPCETKKEFGMPLFSQECEMIIRRGKS